jgi:hypothetical protein
MRGSTGKAIRSAGAAFCGVKEIVIFDHVLTPAGPAALILAVNQPVGSVRRMDEHGTVDRHARVEFEIDQLAGFFDASRATSTAYSDL